MVPASSAPLRARSASERRKRAASAMAAAIVIGITPTRKMLWLMRMRRLPDRVPAPAAILSDLGGPSVASCRAHSGRKPGGASGPVPSPATIPLTAFKRPPRSSDGSHLGDERPAQLHHRQDTGAGGEEAQPADRMKARGPVARRRALRNEGLEGRVAGPGSVGRDMRQDPAPDRMAALLRVVEDAAEQGRVAR